ncbi:MAG: hypothetical protein ABJ215_12765 [Alphaproteobacteria bacterium]
MKQSDRISSCVRATVAATLGLAVVAISQPAEAQETIDLTFLSGYPPPATMVKAVLEGFVPAVDAALAKTGNYKINWNLAHSGQIARPRGELEATEAGLGDITIIQLPFHTDRLPLHELPFKTPFTSRDLRLMSDIFMEMEADIPAFKKLWDGVGQTNLYLTGTVDNYHIISSKKATRISDLKGRKVGAAGPNLPWATAIGAAGVQTNLADAYNSLSTGIYDNMIVWAEAMGTFKLCEPAPFVLDPAFGAILAQALTVNTDRLNDLPSEVQAVLRNNARGWHKMNADLVENGAEKGFASCKANFGTEVEVLSEDERKQWAAALPPMAKEWATRANAQGLPGTQILKRYMDAMRANNQPLLRHWDRD